MTHDSSGAGLRLTFEEDGRVALLTFDRPARRNALDRATMEAFADAVARIEASGEILAVVVGAAGDAAFVAGGDLEDLHAVQGHAQALQLADRMVDALQRLADLDAPSICALDGSAYGGGCDIALACDYRVAAEHVELAFRALRMGVMGGWGAPTRLVRLVGRSAATRLLLFDEPVGADEARTLGLVDEVVPRGQARHRAMALAARLAGAAPLAVRATKRMIAEAEARAPAESLALEKRLFARTWASEDHQEAVRAFRERRSPRWRGR